ncbi:MAG: hypothetical protein LBD13_00980, partial [Spirochaetaceae bacterium]|nr:hypothetical protein [Spirochaetaceae bacterium]
LDYRKLFLDYKKTFLDCKNTGFPAVFCWYIKKIPALRASLREFGGAYTLPTTHNGFLRCARAPANSAEAHPSGL